MKGLNLFRQALADAGEQRQALERTVASLKARRQELNTLPLPRSDFIASVFECIDRYAEDWRTDKLPMTLAPHMKNPEGATGIHLLTSNGAYSGEQIFPVVVYGLFRDEIKKSIKAHIDAMDWPSKVGPDRRARQAELTTITRDLNEMETQLKQISNDARAVGLDLGRLADVHTGKQD